MWMDFRIENISYATYLSIHINFFGENLKIKSLMVKAVW